MTSHAALGSVAALWRYPVKSMLGEEVHVADVGSSGLFGDRAYALVDRSDGKVASAKDTRKWAQLFAFGAAFGETPVAEGSLPPVRITLPSGARISSDQPDLDQVLSQTLQRDVTFRSRAAANAAQPTAAAQDTVTGFDVPQHSFFDAATVHVLTTAALDELGSLYPQGRFDVARFRPNIVIAAAGGNAGFVENGWIGRTLQIGESLRLSVTGPCLRCVMTTLAQSDLPSDNGILRTAARHNNAHVGVYATVLQGGTIRRGDSARLS